MATAKPYLCEVCNLSFSRYKELAIHKQCCVGEGNLGENIEHSQEADISENSSQLTTSILSDKKTLSVQDCVNHDRFCTKDETFEGNSHGEGRAMVCAEGGIRNAIYGLIHKSIVERSVSNDSQNMNVAKLNQDLTEKVSEEVAKYFCNVCESNFADSSELTSHQEICQEQKSDIKPNVTNGQSLGHRQKLRRKCVEFGYHVRVSPWDLEMLMQSQKKVYQCTSCSKSFARKNSLESHILQWHSSETSSTACDVCGKTFKSAISMRLHSRTHGTEKKNYECEDCGRSFSYERSYNSHLLSHTGKKQYECSECGKCFSRKDNMESHMQCHTDEDKPYQTGDLAFDIFDDDEAGAPQTKLPKIVKMKIMHCPYCEKLFKTTGNLKVHMRVHTGEKPYECSVCGKCFSRNGNLQTHMRSHTGEKPCKCEVCGKAFSHISGLRYHMKNHTNEKPFECSTCGKLFKCANGLKYHVDNHPSTEKSFICEECGDAFTQSNDLKLHRTVHTGQVLHSCEVCNKQFLHSYNLKVHMGVHSDEKPFKCEQCGKCFKQSGALKIHTRRHMDMQALKKTTTQLMSMVDNNIE